MDESDIFEALRVDIGSHGLQINARTSSKKKVAAAGRGDEALAVVPGPEMPTLLESSGSEPKRSPTKPEAKKDVSKTLKIGPLRAARKKKNMSEVAPTDARLQAPDSNENVPTIEIIVMPLSLNVRTEDMDEVLEGEVPNESGMYRVMFPADNSEYPVDLTTGNDTLLSRVECERDARVTLMGSPDQQVTVYSANAGIEKM